MEMEENTETKIIDFNIMRGKQIYRNYNTK